MNQVTQDNRHEPPATDPLPIEPGHVMVREHYERLAAQAAQEQQK